MTRKITDLNVTEPLNKNYLSNFLVTKRLFKCATIKFQTFTGHNRIVR